MIVAIVLAAGQSRRMGRPKQSMKIGKKSMLQRVLDVFRRANVDRIVVVLGANEQQVRNSVKFDKELVIINQDHAKGMSGSLKLGLSVADPGADAVIIALADQPFLTAATVRQLIKSFMLSKSGIVVPVYRGKRGNPILFDRSLFSQIMRIRGDVGAKSVVSNNEDRVLEVPVPDRGVVLDIDTPEDYSGVRRRARRGINSRAADN